MNGKKIILCITGSIAAYKAAILVRMLVKEGAEVQVIMTDLAKKFISPLTMATLSKRPVLVEFFDPENGSWNSHVSLGEWADAMLIAPATANTIAKMAGGIADNLLLTTYLSARCPVFVAPAMDLDMYRHPATQLNLSFLQERDVTIIEPGVGELASGLEGKGRMEEPEQITLFMKRYFRAKAYEDKVWNGMQCLITAGPTYEAIDPVRFIGNYSSGKMGFALAEEIANRGAKVHLVTGPTHLQINHPNVDCVRVNSALEMYEVCVLKFPLVDVGIMAAAVADYRPQDISLTKIKRSSEDLSLELVPNPDIAAALGASKLENQVLVGFALETDHGVENARLKIAKKNLDFIVLNPANEEGAGFMTDTNRISILYADGRTMDYELKSKTGVAIDIADAIEQYWEKD